MSLALLITFFLEYVDSHTACYPPGPRPEREAAGVHALDGQFSHDVGELQTNITNWGLTGSQAGLGRAHCDAPSVMWPAGGGIDRLFAAGLWTGAMKNGLPLVAPSQYESEMHSSPDDPINTTRRTHQGKDSRQRYPDLPQRDNPDGLVDEDPLNGIDDDGHGSIDEDFGHNGNQMFAPTSATIPP